MLHPDKTRIVYCQDDNRRGQYEHVEFDFLGFGFRKRSRADQGRQSCSCRSCPRSANRR